MAHTILLVEDDSSLRVSLTQMLTAKGYAVSAAGSGTEALLHVQTTPPDLLLCDLHMPGMSGLDLYEKLKASFPRLAVIIMTGHGSAETAIQANRLGALEYLRKPLDRDELLRRVERALSAVHHSAVPASLRGTSEPLLGESEAMYRLDQASGRAAAEDSPVLIRGETGTGKDLVARAIHEASTRRAGPFLTVHCLAVPETLLGSELFGHEIGAFPGASSRRPGKCELAHGGSLFLDEIGELPLSLQARCLRLIEEGVCERAGGSEAIPIQVRLLAVTSTNLEARSAEGLFREDLHQALGGLTIWLPPLRERGEDIVLLARYFLERFSQEFGVEPPTLSAAVISLLMTYPWPGNVRELANVIRQGLLLSGGRSLEVEDLRPLLVSRPQQSVTPPHLPRPVAPCAGIRVGMTLDQAERLLIERTLTLAGGNKKETARVLGISRNSLYDKLRRYSLRKSSVEDDSGTS